MRGFETNLGERTASNTQINFQSSKHGAPAGSTHLRAFLKRQSGGANRIQHTDHRHYTQSLREGGRAKFLPIQHAVGLWWAFHRRASARANLWLCNFALADGKTARASLGAIGPWSPVDQLAVLAAGLRVAILTLRGLTARLTAALWLRVNGAIASHHTAIAISGADSSL